MISDPCLECRGAGRVTEERKLSVNIPSGIEDGTRIRLAGEGEAGLRGGPSGDLYIFLSIKPHAFFQRDGADIFCRVPVSVTTAALGGEFQVPTIDGGQTRVKVPEGTQTGKQFRLKGKGMPVLRSGRVGDMYIQVAVETPRNLTRRQRELLQEFEQVSSAENNPEFDRVLRPRPRFPRRPRRVTSASAPWRAGRRHGLTASASSAPGCKSPCSPAPSARRARRSPGRWRVRSVQTAVGRCSNSVPAPGR